MKPDLESYLKAAENSRVVPLWDEFVADTETPVSLYSKISSENESSYLLESVTGGENLARYSFIGIDPVAEFRAKNSLIEIEEEGQKYKRFGDPVKYLKEFVNRYKTEECSGLPYFFGGAVGYLSYDWIRYLENIPNRTEDDMGLPDGLYTIHRITVIYDHAKNIVKIVYLSLPGESPTEDYTEAEKRINEIRHKIFYTPLEYSNFDLSGSTPERVDGISLDKNEYMRGVEKIKDYIKEGDTFQTVLSTRLETKTSASPFEIYRCLRTINPSPYTFFLNYKEFQLIGGSPEMLVGVKNGKIKNRPIAGTRQRGESEQKDRELAEEMKNCPKERAEHVMLVDLGRNDVGRVSSFGSVEVPELMEVEMYSHVMHLSSLVEGQLAKNKDPVDALMSCFPAGTVSGAPKIRAMEIIEEIENLRRGPYAGAVGYIGLNGNIDTCITIRTIVMKDSTAYIQAGAGVVADSDPSSEYEESLNKGKALMKALLLAERKVPHDTCM